jgi:two-component sensor histidine kinase
VTELVSNSLLHAFPEEERGSVRIIVTLSERDGRYTLSVGDNGQGFRMSSDSSGGLRLVRTLVADDLRGTVRVDPGGQRGVTATVEFGTSPC